MVNKRGQELSTSTIILIILGVVVLIVLIIGFTTGWGALKERLIGGETNVDKVSQACSTACFTNSIYDFCNKKRELKSEDETLEDVTCNYLSQKTDYGIESCSGISCSNVVIVDLTGEETLQDKCSGNQGKTVQALVNNKLQSYSCTG